MLCYLRWWELLFHTYSNESLYALNAISGIKYDKKALASR